jgi:hypothetical protein
MNQRASARILVAAFIFLAALACECNTKACTGDSGTPQPTSTPNAAQVAETAVQMCERCGTIVAGFRTKEAENPMPASDPNYSTMLTAIAPGFCYGAYGCTQALSAQLTNTITIQTVTPQAAAPAAACVPAPMLIDPLAGQPAAVSSLMLTWRTNYALKPGEMFDVLVSPTASDLVATSDANQPAIVGRTAEKSFPIDLFKWKYAGTIGRFYWSVRIADSDGVFENCTAERSSFMLIAPATDTPTRVPSSTPTLVPCLPPPGLFDPPDGKSFAAKNTILRWRSDHVLKPDEEYGVLASMEGDAQPTLLTKTRDMTAPLDLLQWAFAGRFGKFSWNVRLQRTDGTVLSCSSPAFSFTLTGYTPEAGAPAPPGQPAQPPKPPCPFGAVCP